MRPADGGTFDFGEAFVILGGRETKVHLGCLRLDYSSQYFVCALPTERQEALFECHLRGFAYLGGVPGRMRYDNLKPAVHKILTGQAPPGTSRLGRLPVPFSVRERVRHPGPGPGEGRGGKPGGVCAP